METKIDFRQELSEKLTALVGYPLLTGWIVNDNPGFNYYIRNLQPGYPVCVMDYHVMPGGRPQLMLVLAYADYRRLEKAECVVDEYIETSHWSFGYYVGGGSIYGAYWQPFDTEAGIHNTKAIRHYLWQMACRIYQHSLGYQPPVSLCENCQNAAESCRCSQLKQEDKLEAEIREFDGRKKLFEALGQRVQAELEFEVYDVLSHTRAKDVVELYAGYQPNTVRIFASQDLLNSLLYHPNEECDWQGIANSLKLVRRRRDIEIGAEIDPEMPNKHQACLAFWGDDMPSEGSTKAESDSDPENATRQKNYLQSFQETIIAIGLKVFRSRWH